MSDGVWQRAWARYRGRKRKRGILFDFLFLVAVVVVLVPPLRRGVVTYAVRATLTQPSLYDKIVFVGADDVLRLKTANGADTVLSFPSSKPVLIAVGSVWSAPTRAGLSSVAKSAERLRGRVDVVFLSSDEPSDVDQYFRRRGYSAIRPLFLCDDWVEGVAEDGVLGQLLMSVPSSALIGADGRVVVKKLGAARWSGARADEAFAVAEGR
ncbi:MAG: hypothetical protein MR215_05050 [Bacteroidales bacterium]|nr:hypothetical protein [Bacteroidales bacterium]MDY4174083.1 hypothetical protein [Bacteroidales bacterium]